MSYKNMIKNYDIIVVGAGAVGLASALALTQTGFRVALIAITAPQTKSTDPERAIALSHGSCLMLQQWGVWPAIQAFGTGLIQHIEVCEAAGRGRVSIHHHELQLETLGQVVEMGSIIAPLWRAVQTSCDVFCPATIQNLQESDTHIQVLLQHEGGECCLQARLLLGADGAYSPVRRLAGIGTSGWPHNRFALVASVGTQHAHHNTAYECFQHDGPLALLPMPDGRLSLVWVVTPHEAMRLLQASDQDFITDLTGALCGTPAEALGGISSVGKRGSFPLELRLARTMAKGRVALVGNAGHNIHPVAGQGMNLGFRDVANITTLLSHELARDDPATSLCLQQYAQQRKVDILAVASFTEGLLAAFAPKHACFSTLRRWGMASLLPQTPWKRLILRHATGMAQGRKP